MKSLDRVKKLRQKTSVIICRNKICHNMAMNAKLQYTKKPHDKWGFSSSTRGRTRTGTAYTANGF